MYPHSHTGQINGERDLGMAVVAGWVGLLVLLSPRRHPIGAALALLCAVGMVLQAWLAPHDESTTIGLEIAVAVTYVLGGLMALDVRRPRAGVPASALQRSGGAVAR
jgi:peptidoglycan/LPS O-acetylase OafA/YrhL